MSKEDEGNESNRPTSRVYRFTTHGETNSKTCSERLRSKQGILIMSIVLILILLTIIGIIVWRLLSQGNAAALQVVPKTEDNFIWVDTGNLSVLQHHVKAIDDFLEVYINQTDRVKCNYENPPPKGKLCSVDIDQLGPCSKERNYGYSTGKPCIFLKLSEVPDWIPEFYNDSKSLPPHMPEYIQLYINNTDSYRMNTLNTIWVSCEGENPADREHIGPIQYIPSFGFPGYYFPYQNTEGYLSPFVAIRFENPRSGVLINIKCQVWVKNLSVSNSTQIKLLID